MSAQTQISGIVSDDKGKAVTGANVFIEGTYDGDITDENGAFLFTTTESGVQILTVNAILYESQQIAVTPEDLQPVTIILKKAGNALDEVVITAGTFETGDKSRAAVLKPLDIVTTAGSAGNIIAALQTLPGTQMAADDGRLFVRGGEANETQTFIDGVRVAQPYGAQVNNMPTRGRFSPFLFSGISFSTGGYGAEFGDALSSVLLLNTINEPEEDATDISLMTVGLGIGHTKKWDRRSLSINLSYIDLEPYHLAVPQNVDWNRAFRSLSGEAVFRQKFEDGLLKIYAAFDASKFDFNQQRIDLPKSRINLNNDNFYLNSTYSGYIGGNWNISGGLSYGYSNNDIDIDANNLSNDEHAVHAKVKLIKKFSGKVRLTAGVEHFQTRFAEGYQQPQNDNVTANFNSAITAAFVETDISIVGNLAGRIGLRASYNDLLNESNISPRMSLGYQINKHHQLSIAYGDYAQAPDNDVLKYSDSYSIKNQKSEHYIVNHQFSISKRLLRTEIYYKKYADLITFAASESAFANGLSNGGYGFAKGVDVFWRDNKSITNVEYWLSYSYIDTKRKYRDFPVEATPNFAAKHTLSAVGKYWINSLRSQLSVTNSFASGRPFHDPNKAGYLQSKTMAYNNLSLSWAYLLTAQKILYFSVSNVLGSENVFNYEYSATPNESGQLSRRAINQTADRFFFVGFFWTISNDKTNNQLKNL